MQTSNESAVMPATTPTGRSPEQRIAAIALLVGAGLTLIAGLGFGHGHMNTAEISVVVICPVVALGLLMRRPQSKV
jgi:hypothetical protein